MADVVADVRTTAQNGLIELEKALAAAGDFAAVKQRELDQALADQLSLTQQHTRLSSMIAAGNIVAKVEDAGSEIIQDAKATASRGWAWFKMVGLPAIGAALGVGGMFLFK